VAADTYDYGSARYRRVSDVLDQLTLLQVRLSGPGQINLWEQTRVGVKNGNEITSQLIVTLQEMGEGAKQPKA
jgi:hypothetical protein